MTSETSQGSCARAELARDFKPLDVAERFGFHARAQAPILRSPELDHRVLARHEDTRDPARSRALGRAEMAHTRAVLRTEPLSRTPAS